MRIVLKQYEKALKELSNLKRHQQTVAVWETAAREFRPAPGQRLVEIQIEDGKTRYVTEALSTSAGGMS